LVWPLCLLWHCHCLQQGTEWLLMQAVLGMKRSATLRVQLHLALCARAGVCVCVCVCVRLCVCVRNGERACACVCVSGREEVCVGACDGGGVKQ